MPEEQNNVEDTHADLRFARTMLMDEHVDERTSRAFGDAYRDVFHYTQKQHPIAEEEFARLRRPLRGRTYAAIDAAFNLLFGTSPAERDAWLSSVILAGVSLGLATARKHETIQAEDVESAKETLCDYWPKCARMRAEAAVHAAAVLAMNRERLARSE